VTRRANVVGTGLIGASIGLNLRGSGWHVSGSDADAEKAAQALDLGALDVVGVDAAAELTFVAAPVGELPNLVTTALMETTGLVTDVGSVKATVAAAVQDERFVGGHPMAGSEQEGVDGARRDLFAGATWVLTPTEVTASETYARVRTVVSSMGAEVVALDPERHDALVAVVSHVPHLTAASLMCLADERSEDHRALLRLAAGGFRDMTRVASGHPGIWPDICRENSVAIVDVLGQLIDSLGDLRELVAESDREGLLGVLESARAARVNLPQAVPSDVVMAELRVVVFDRPGEIARITTMATEIDVNIYDLEIAHSGEGNRGVLIMIVEAALAERLQGALMANGYRPSLSPLP
jgi:prephenate dehydrogenase